MAFQLRLPSSSLPVLVLLSSMAPTASLDAQAPDRSSPEMEALATYVGTWRSEERETQDGRGFHYLYRLAWFDSGETIAEMVITQVFDDGEDRVVWHGFKGWDPVEETVYYHAFSPGGRAASGQVELDDGNIVTAFRGWSPRGDPVEIRDVFSPVSDGTFTNRTLMRSGTEAEWREISADRWRKVAGEGDEGLLSADVLPATPSG